MGNMQKHVFPLIHTKPDSQNPLLRPPRKDERLSGSPSLSVDFLYIGPVSVPTGCCVLSEKHRKHKNYEIDPPKWPVLPSSYGRLQEKSRKSQCSPQKDYLLTKRLQPQQLIENTEGPYPQTDKWSAR